MKISIIIAAIIVSLAALFGFQQKEKITTLTTEWEELKTTALEKNISTDPDATFSSQRARSDSARAAREKAINDFASELAAFAQKMEAAQESGDINQSEIQKEAIGFLDKLTNLSPTDLKSLIKALAADTSIKDKTKREIVMMSIMMIAADNPEAALTLIKESDESLGLGDRQKHLLPMVISQYAAKDPAGAATWIAENEDQLGDKAEDIKMMLLTSAAKTDFSSALAMVETLKLSDDSNAYGRLAGGVTKDSKDQFLKALQNKAITKEQRQAALSSLTNSPFIKDDFEAATEWLDGPNLSAEDRDSIIQSLNYYGVRENPQEWLSWIGKQENRTKKMDQATAQILRGWTQENFVAAGEWVQDQEIGPAKNTAVTTYAKTLAPHEPAAAADWAVTLPESEDRTKLLKTIHTSLKAEDPAAAAVLAEEHGLLSEN